MSDTPVDPRYAVQVAAVVSYLREGGNRLTPDWVTSGLERLTALGFDQPDDPHFTAALAAVVGGKLGADDFARRAASLRPETHEEFGARAEQETVLPILAQLGTWLRLGPSARTGDDLSREYDRYKNAQLAVAETPSTQGVPPWTSRTPTQPPGKSTLI